MTELDVLKLFYDEIVLRGVTRDQVFLTLEEEAAEVLSKKLGQPVLVNQLQRYADICIANEWLERTTADPYYKYLSLTEAGLQVFLGAQYS
ncbi:hypothetical protein [Legionella sp. km772]|uniref:hypothetical protein n=1 Tax=Legionella sp. km772 TaxID=2498111 RepID=UPI000F8F557E|nr:hypothetical protein [Legionella sp. km772]RUR11903.1 hypothetical protein ELY15_06710 [Legionella sp. km772]